MPVHLGSAAKAGSMSSAWHGLVQAFLRHDRETPTLLTRLIDEFPDEPHGPLIKGYMLLMLARPELRHGASEALAEGQRRMVGKSDARLSAYAVGLQGWLQGNPRAAIHAMEQVISENPMDAMAIKISHAIRFMLGDADGMRRSLARVVSVYTDGVPYAGFIKGCYAFALEETGDYAGAEGMGRRAVELEPHDAWGRHAVAHVYEMTGQAQTGLQWLSDQRQWAHCNNFSFHMHWHVALFQLELGQTGEALQLYDDAIRQQKTDDFRDIANAASLLQRIELDGFSVGNRWEELADIAERRIGDRQLVFADLHYLIALLGAGRFSSAASLAVGLLDSRDPSHNSALSSDLGGPLAAGLVAFKAGRMAEASALLEPLHHRMQAIGGSHAQRDVFAQIRLEALVRSGAAPARHALSERRQARGGSNRFAERRLASPLAASAQGQVVRQALQLTPALQAH
jgi:hypothetical protein